MKRGYTLIEVLIALVILGILAVPLTYILVHTGEGSSRARSLDDAMALVRDDWSLCRATKTDSLRDSTWERSLASGNWKIVRDVFDSSDRAAMSLPAIKKKNGGLLPPVEISTCALRREGSGWDTVRCFGWLRPRWSAAP